MTLTLLMTTGAHAFDHNYQDYGSLLKTHVFWLPGGHASVVDYAQLRTKSPELQKVERLFSSVSNNEFQQFTRQQQMAFLINAYNFFTLKLIAENYPVASIRDLGNILRSTWKRPFFKLLDNQRTLDWVEHDMLRPNYKEPRIHFAINCASIGCPALYPEPFTANKLESHLADTEKRFLKDRSRNRFNASNNSLMVSRIFEWFGSDFERPNQTLQQWLASRANLLADTPESRKQIAAGQFKLQFLSYDWALNDRRSTQRR